MHFTDLKLSDPLLKAVNEKGYRTPTPVQQQAIPPVLSGRDLIGCAQTGTGKTAAFALPILERMLAARAQRQSERRAIRVLVLTPTRELASQIEDEFRSFSRYTPFRSAVIFGGVGQNNQVTTLRNGVDILIATPGRLLDLMNQGYVRLDRLDVFVLDEADRMLDMGFIHDVRKVIAALPKRRQTLLFSATMPSVIQELANSILIDPAYVEVTPQATTVELIDQSVFFVGRKDKRALLVHLLKDSQIRRVLVFTRTKHGANKLVEQLDRDSIRADAIHGNKSQSARERALLDFRQGRTRVLVATDIAARGLDIADVTHVINFDLPNEPESYVHRIGRTARAGASGVAYSFCDSEERAYLRDIEKLIRLRVPVVADHPYHALAAAAPANEAPARSTGASSSNGNSARRSRRRRPSRRRDTSHSGSSARPN
ncbi:MAG: DEAD/DEAH box helicase [Chloroflexi bacterium]|nr:DEAD/DEAH box helicase [Chloroflexota bacterium]